MVQNGHIKSRSFDKPGDYVNRNMEDGQGVMQYRMPREHVLNYNIDVKSQLEILNNKNIEEETRVADNIIAQS